MKKTRAFFIVTIPLAIACIAIYMSGCAGFDSQWKKGAMMKTSGRDLAGRWEGKWISKTNGHSGALQAVITPAGANKYHAVFHATYAKVLTFNYAVDFETKQHGERVDFTGAADLPSWAGGHYASEGFANRTDFSATYKSKYDEGRFEMTRVIEKSAH